MADRRVDIDIRTNASGHGIDDTKDGLEKLGDSAAGAGAAAASSAGGIAASFAKLKGQVAAVTSAVGALRNLITGFGIAQAIIAVVGQFKAIKDSIDEAREANVKLNEQIGELQKNPAIKAAADMFVELAKEIDNAAARADAARASAEAAMKALRSEEDARSRLSEATELAALDPSDPLYAEKRGEITAKFQSGRAKADVRRRQEDLERELAGLQAQREDLARKATLDNVKAGASRSAAESMLRDAAKAEKDGEKLVQPSWVQSAFGWKIPEPDPEKRLAAAKKAAELRAKADAENVKAKAFENASAEKGAKSYDLLDLIEKKSAGRTALKIEGDAVKIEGSDARRSAAAATENKRAAIVASAEKEKREEDERYHRELAEARRLQTLGGEMANLDDEADRQRGIIATSRAAASRARSARPSGLAGKWSGGRIVSPTEVDAAGKAAMQASAAAAQAALAALQRIEAQQRALAAQLNGRRGD